MKLDIQKIKLKELKSFVESETYRGMPVVPITPHRAESYINNPHSEPEDIVLYLGFIQNKLVSFRSIFADEINSKEKKTRFGWCSGNWVAPEYRRMGFSKQLLQCAYADWNEKLMFTNYAPNSEKLYLETGWFHSVHQFDGIRAYLFPKTSKLISTTNKICQFIFPIVDFCISLLSNLRLLFFNKKGNEKVTFKDSDTPDQECYNLLSKSDSYSFFNRSSNELKWIFDYPWIIDDNGEAENRYPFSSHDSSFKYRTIKIFNGHVLVGFFIFSIREGHLKTLYFNYEADQEKEIVQFLKGYCKKNKIEMTTIYNNEIAQHFFKRKFPFLHVRKYGQKIYSSFEINKNKEYQFQDGDGDVIFT